MSELDERRAVAFITGIQAAGKTTVARGLAARFARSAHVAGDALYPMIVNGHVALEPGDRGEGARQLRLRHRQSAMLADSFFDAGFTVIVEDNAYGERRLDDFVADIRARPLLVIVLVPSPAAVAERERRREKTAYRTASFTIEDLDDAIRHGTTRLGLWLDTSDHIPDETVDEILRRWDEAVVAR